MGFEPRALWVQNRSLYRSARIPRARGGGGDSAPSPKQSPSLHLETLNRGHEQTRPRGKRLRKCWKPLPSRGSAPMPGRGESNSSPGRRFLTLPACRIGRRRPQFFRRGHRELLCGGVQPPCVRGGAGPAALGRALVRGAK